MEVYNINAKKVRRGGRGSPGCKGPARAPQKARVGKGQMGSALMGSLQMLCLLTEVLFGTPFKSLLVFPVKKERRSAREPRTSVVLDLPVGEPRVQGPRGLRRKERPVGSRAESSWRVSEGLTRGDSRCLLRGWNS